MAEEMMENVLDPVIRYFVHTVPWREVNYEAKEGERSQYTSMVVMKTPSCFSAQWFLRISSVSTQQQQIYATKYPSVSGLRGSLQHLSIWKRWKFLPSSPRQKILAMNSSGETYCKNTIKIRASVGRPEVIQIVFWCGFEACSTRAILLYSWNRRKTTDATLMSRIHAASQWKGDPCERMDSKQDKNRFSLQNKGLLSWRKIQCWSLSSFSISRQHRFVGQNCERRWQIRDRIDADRERR